MKNYNELFLHLASNNSRLFKEAELEKHKDDELLKRILFMGLDPFTNYWIRKIPDYRWSEFGSSDTLDLDMALDELEYLSNRTFTGHAGINHLKDILERMDNHDDCFVIEKIINGDFKCGVSTSTINKIWPGLIFEYPIMLCEKSNAKTLAKMEYPARADIKLDGMRCNPIVNGGEVTFHTRNGKKMTFHGHLEQEALEASNGLNVVYDGELWVDDGTGKPLPRKIGNGILNKAIHGTISEKEAAAVRFTAWDRIPHDAWLKGYYDSPLYQREVDLNHDFNRVTSGKFKTIEYDLVHDEKQANIVFNKRLGEKEEGIILKNLNGHWEDKRSKNQIKFKAERDADLLCVGYEEGSGKYEGLIGNLILTTSDGLIEVSCGSGLSDEDRKQDPSYFLNNIVEIVYNERIKSAGGKKESLFLPIFKTVRHDKSIANSSKELK